MRSNRVRLRDWAVLLGLTLLLLLIDQGSKWLVRQKLPVGDEWAPIPALAKIFTFTHVQNTGVSFGMLPGWGWVFMLVYLAVLVAVLVYYPRIPPGYWQLRLASALILAGDLGNVIDRLWTAFLRSEEAGGFLKALPLASVTDFFDVKVWPVWNVADMCVVSGVAIVAWTLWRAEQAGTSDELVPHDS